MSQGESQYSTVKSGLTWLVMGSISSRIITFGMGIILARHYLNPSQFGLVNMCAISIMALDLVRDFGIVEALLKREKLNDDSVNTAFWLMTLFAALACMVIMISAPAVASLFHEPSMTAYLRVMCFSLLISGLTAVPLALLQRHDRWQEYASTDFIVSVAGSFITLVLAVFGAREWSLVIGSVLKGVVQAIYVWVLLKWNPKMRFSIPIAKELLAFGKWITAVRFPDFFMYFSDNAYLGRYAGKQNLGYYSQPYNWIQQPLNLFILQVAKVLYPNLAKSIDDTERCELFVKSYRLLCFLVIPTYVFLGFHAQLFVDVVYGPKWAPSGAILMWLCAAATVRALTADGLQGYFWASTRGKQYAWPLWVAVTFIFGAMIYSRGTWDGKQIAMLFTAGMSIRGTINLFLLSTPTTPLSYRIIKVIWSILWPCILIVYTSLHMATTYIPNQTLQLLTSMLCCAVIALVSFVVYRKRIVVAAS